MAKPKKKMKKAAPKARKVAPKAVKRKKPASKGPKRAVAAKASKRTAPKKISKPIERRVPDVVSSATRASVDFESAVNVAGAITPVPGGVGPVTNVALLRNVVKSAEKMGLSASLER